MIKIYYISNKKISLRPWKTENKYWNQLIRQQSGNGQYINIYIHKKSVLLELLKKKQRKTYFISICNVQQLFCLSCNASKTCTEWNSNFFWFCPLDRFFQFWNNNFKYVVKKIKKLNFIHMSSIIYQYSNVTSKQYASEGVICLLW